MEKKNGISTETERRETIALLEERQCSCVIRKGDAVRFFYRRGIRDLYDLLSCEAEALDGAFVADKVVGKGAAALMILGGVSGVYARVASRSALELFEKAGVEVQCAAVVPHIIDRAGTGMCPVERRCADSDTPQQCLAQIEEFLKTAGV